MSFDTYLHLLEAIIVFSIGYVVWSVLRVRKRDEE
jgi:hypothetical protein